MLAKMWVAQALVALSEAESPPSQPLLLRYYYYEKLIFT